MSRMLETSIFEGLTMSRMLETSIIQYFPKELHDLALENLKNRLEESYWSGQIDLLKKQKGDLLKKQKGELDRYNDNCSVDDETVTYMRNERIENEN